ncbi:MAG: peptidase M3 [Micavibrio sp.]|nr:peptidase M3 [Micavibrio sp.]|tara:strand:+ start:984 stop:3038 length:2055 start_codon:yes stop_codon:yes gene_type:complete
MPDLQNPFFKTFDTPYSVPPFKEIEVGHFLPAIEAGIEKARKNIDAIKTNKDEPSFENTIEALECASEDLGYVSSIFYNLLSVIGGDDYNEVAEKISPLTADFSSDVSLDEELFARVKSVYDKRNSLDLETVEMTLLDDTYQGFVRSGALLGDEDKKILREINKQSSNLGTQFSQNVIKSSAKFELKITDEADLSGLPETIIESARHEAECKGYENTWLFTLDFPSFIPFLTYSDKREYREKMWKAFSNRAFKDDHDNSDLIKKIVELRNKRSKLLGFNTFSDFVLERRMAKTTDSVMEFLETLRQTYRPAAEDDLKNLKSFAKEKDGIEELRPWDIGYYSEKRKQELYKFSEEDLRPYFPLQNVLEGTFLHFQKLFNLEFKKAENIPTWHDDVQAFEVQDKDTGDLFGILYADFYVRENKRSGAWKASFRDHGLYQGQQRPAIMEIVCNFSKPTPDKPSLHTHNEVLTLFHEMGHAIHALLGRTKYPSTSGTNVLWDFVELPSQVQENWLYERETLNMVSGHYETGDKIPDDLVEKLRSAKNYMSGWTGLRQVSLGLLDMAYHVNDNLTPDSDIIEFEDDAVKEAILFDRFGGPTSTSFSHIFAGGYAAGYYSYKWAEVLDADTFELFLEKGLYDKDTAMKYRHEILEQGGSDHPLTLYKKFRGREADPEALLRREGLIDKAS